MVINALKVLRFLEYKKAQIRGDSEWDELNEFDRSKLALLDQVHDMVVREMLKGE